MLLARIEDSIGRELPVIQAKLHHVVRIFSAGAWLV
jgi:hypothetical protein